MTQNAKVGDCIGKRDTNKQTNSNFIYVDFSVVKNGETANSTAFTLTEAMPANVEWKDDVYGSIEIRSDGKDRLNVYA